VRRVVEILAIGVLVLLAPLKAHAGDATYDITVKADGTKADGSPWDGIAALGNSRANLNALPDIAVCIVKASAKPDCIWRPQGRRLFSLCQNAFTCKFPGVALQPLPIGLVFIDIDVRDHDLIDIVILTGNEDAAANAEITESLRAAMSILQPSHSEDTKEHMVRNAKVMPLADCAGGKTCQLTQSVFRLDARP
jgi:hypothetical protein